MLTLDFDQPEIAWDFSEHLFESAQEYLPAPLHGLELGCLPLCLTDTSSVTARVLEQIARYDHVILVIETGQCEAHQLQQATQLIHQFGGRLLGVIANDRCNPPLNLELCRQVDRIRWLLPNRFIQWLKERIMQNSLLSIDA